MSDSTKILVCVAFLVVFAATVVTFSMALKEQEAELEALREEPHLPYTRPHEEFTNEEGQECAGWYFNHSSIAVVLCEGQNPAIIRLKSNSPRYES